MGLITDLLLLFIIVILVILFYPKIIATLQIASSLITNFNFGGLGKSFNFPNSTQSNQSNQKIESGPLINYTLSLINKDRSTYGLSNVTLSAETSAQQHANNMLQYDYFSHWDIYGMKPYMRYTLLGGTGAVQENIAYTKSGVKACLASLCTSVGNVNVTMALKNMEYNFVYNDSICCNNGHRDNILDPQHNQVSIGIAYNSSDVFLVEDFINNYINWLNDTPTTNTTSMETTLEGSINQSYKLSTIEISYDPLVANMTTAQLNSTSEYGYGNAVAGVVNSALNYYPSLTTIVADNYYTQGNDFLVSFNMRKLISGNGPGEYTIEIWLNGTQTNSSFIGSTYTLFVNSQGQLYTPSNV
jgi:uncharacterized protein YkwD